MNPYYPLVSLRARHCCEYCHAPEALFNFPFEVEHIAPLAHGGGDGIENLALACRACNVYKAAYLAFIGPDTDELTLLFHPRIDDWEDHFVADPTTGWVVGKTAIGRVTIHVFT
jgi:hypothetical protein